MAISLGAGSTDLPVIDLRQIIKMDIEASNELQVRIDQLRHDILQGGQPGDEQIDLMDSARKDMTRDLVQRIETIERRGRLAPKDREMLQALSARLAVSDKQSMRLAELRDMHRNVSATRQPRVDDAEDEELPLGGRPRTPATSPPGQPPSRPRSAQDARSMSPGPILESATRKRYSQDVRDSPCTTPPISVSSPTFPATSRKSMDVARPTPPQRIPSSGLQSPARPTGPPRSATDCSRLQAPPPPRDSHRQSKHQYRKSTPSLAYPFEHIGSSPVSSPRISFHPRDVADAVRSPSSSNASYESVQQQPTPPGCLERERPTRRDPRYEDYYDCNCASPDWNVPLQHKSHWPLLYRILDVDPMTAPAMFDSAARRALALSGQKHDPAIFPNDPEAPVRWAAVTQAFETLINPERRRLYNAQHKEPRWFDDFDFALLSVNAGDDDDDDDGRGDYLVGKGWR